MQYKIVGWTTSALLKTQRKASSSFFSFEVLRSEHLSIYVRGNLENIQKIIDNIIYTIVISIVYININTDIDTLFIIDININGIINKTSGNCTAPLSSTIRVTSFMSKEVSQLRTDKIIPFADRTWAIKNQEIHLCEIELDTVVILTRDKMSASFCKL